MFIIRNSIGCGQCLRPKMLSDIFSFSFTLLLPNWLLISIRTYSGIARFPCDSMAFLHIIFVFCNLTVSCRCWTNKLDLICAAVTTKLLLPSLWRQTRRAIQSAGDPGPKLMIERSLIKQYTRPGPKRSRSSMADGRRRQLGGPTTTQLGTVGR